RPPVAKRDPKTTQTGGLTLVDDYAWLRNKGAPDVVAYLEAENAYADVMTKSTEALQKTLYDEMVGRLQEDDATPPIKNGEWQYYRRFEKGKQFAIHCRKKATGAEATILDLNEMATPGHPFVAVEALEVSDDGRTLAYLVDFEGFRQYTLK